ncbi:MAG: fibronectin type III domain-containing protein [Thermoplasmatota archaeon]
MHLASDKAYGMKVDGEGNTYVTGDTTARQFPVTPGAYSVDWNGSQDAYLFKMNHNGTEILFCTLIGGSSDDHGMVVELDGSGNIYLSGRIASADFPTTGNAYDDTHGGGYDVFVSKFNPTASNLIFSTFVGGASSEWPQNLALDSSLNVFVGGITNGDGFPTSQDPICGSYGGGDIDGFLFKLESMGRGLVYSTFIGGDHDDRVTGLAVDSEGYAYISGYTRSSNFPLTEGAYGTEREGSSDAYIMKVAHNGSVPEYSTLFGGSEGDGIYDLKMDPDGDLVFVGLSYSTDLPTTAGVAFPAHIGDADIFLGEMDINCTTVKRCTYLGSTGSETPAFLCIGATGSVIITGTTTSDTFPVTSEAVIGTLQDFSDPFLMSVLPDWSGVQYSTYLGGGRIDSIAGAGTDSRGKIFAAGSTDNENFPTTNDSYHPDNNGFEDAYVLSISLDLPPTPPRDLSARAGDGFVDLTWTTPLNPGSLDLSGYDVYRGESSGTFSLLASLSTIPHYNDTNVINGRTYYYHVRAKNPALDSVPSPEVQATPLGVPDTPGEFKAEGGYKKVDLTWMHPVSDGGTPITGYNIYRVNGPIEIVIPMDSDGTGWTDEVVESGTEYEYGISAVNLVGESPIGGPVTATPVSEPSPPLNLSLESGDGFSMLTWEPPVSDGGMPIREYNIYRGDDGAQPVLIRTLGPNNLEYNDTSVHNGIEYSYHVRVSNLIGESLPTEILTTSPMTVPGVPLRFKALEGQGEVLLTWEEPLSDGGSPLIGYRVSKTAGDDDPEYMEVEGLSYIDNDVQNGAAYTYSIASVNSMGLSPWSVDIRATPASVPGSPELLLLSAGPHHVHIRWSTPEDDGGRELISFELLRGGDGSPAIPFRTFGPGVREFNDTTVISGNEYLYSIRAVNEVGSSALSAPLTVIPLGVPSAPIGISLRVQDEDVLIAWSEPLDDGGSPIIGYSVLRTDLISMEEENFDVDAGESEFRDTQTRTGSNYEYRISAGNEMGFGPSSDAVTVTIYRQPSQIQGLRAVFEKGSAKLTWDPIDPTATGDLRIEVQRSVDSGDYLTIAILEGTSTGFTDRNIRDGALYSYRVIASNDAGSSEPSNIATLEIGGSPSSTISGSGLLIMLLGTILPLIIAALLIFLLLRNRKGSEEEVAESTPLVPEGLDQASGQQYFADSMVPVVHQGHGGADLPPSYPASAEQPAPFLPEQTVSTVQVESYGPEQPPTVPESFLDLISDPQPAGDLAELEEVVQ